MNLLWNSKLEVMSREQRRLDRLKKATVSKVDLHSKQNHSFHFNLTPLESWDLLSRISQEEYFNHTGKSVLNSVDKTKLAIKKVS